MTVAAELFNLQRLDTELEAKQGALALLQTHLEDGDGLDESREALEASRHQLRDLETTEKDLELQDEELSAHLSQMETKLYSGRINSPKELNDLNNDVAMLKRRRQELDERVLLLMDEVEVARNALAASEAALQEAVNSAGARRESMTSEKDETTRQISQLEAQRADQASQLPPAALSQYDVVRERRRPAVASVERGVCSGCRVEIPDHLIKEARRQLTFCSSCNRILFVA
ncbi:MAG TPA: C4-type zinc ribbon domain-containing protein [Dehalococcoidia bacterium]|nr:C4-type zinc ribbon domain-containing protein [Dehalococcoidia bacterium]